MGSATNPTRPSPKSGAAVSHLAFSADTGGIAPAGGWQLHPIGSAPSFARLHHRAFPNHLPADAAAQFDALSAELSVNAPTVGAILAGGSFGRTELPLPTQKREPNRFEFDACVSRAEAWIREFEASRSHRSNDLAFGLDVYASSTQSASVQPIAQFIVLSGAGAEARLLASKRMPSPQEVNFLYCDGDDHNLPVVTQITGLGTTLALVCHEATAMYHRAIAASKHEWRIERRQAINNDIRRVDVGSIFNAIHSLNDHGDHTFYSSYNAITDERRDIRLAGAFGSGHDVKVGEAIRLARRLTRGFPSYLEAFPSNW
jgi:hypothetical protein